MSTEHLSPEAQLALTKLRALSKMPQFGGVLAAQRKILNQLNAKDSLIIALELARLEPSNG